jgi:hypothetical protein
MSKLNIPGPEIGYTDILDTLTNEYLKEQRETGKDVSNTPLRPSAAGKCSRELAYELMEYAGFAKYDKDLYNANTHRIFGLGHSVEYHIIKEMEQRFKGLFQIKYKQQSLSFARLEAKNHPQLSQWLEGSSDLTIWSEKYKCLADVKSKKAKYSSYRNSDWEETADKLGRMQSVTKMTENCFYVNNLREFLKQIDAFWAMNFFQINLYACNPFMVERGIDHASLFYYNKNTSELREIRFKPDQELYNETIAKFQRVLDAVDQKQPELATKDQKFGSMKCAFCSFKKECWSEGDALKAFFKSLPPKAWPKDTDHLGDAGYALEELYGEFKQVQHAEEKKKQLEDDIIQVMAELGVSKIRFHDKEVYELKYLKSPREHVELRRSKT